MTYAPLGLRDGVLGPRWAWPQPRAAVPRPLGLRDGVMVPTTKGNSTAQVGRFRTPQDSYPEF
jgi:hypothetical protein